MPNGLQIPSIWQVEDWIPAYSSTRSTVRLKCSSSHWLTKTELRRSAGPTMVIATLHWYLEVPMVLSKGGRYRLLSVVWLV